MLYRWLTFFSLALAGLSWSAQGLELHGFLTKNCEAFTGMIVHIEDGVVEYLDLNGNLRELRQSQIQTLYTFDVLVNPFPTMHIAERALTRLKMLYTENSSTPSAYAFAIRFVDDLVIFYDLNGKTRVITYADLLKLRPANKDQLGDHRPPEYREAVLNLSAQSDRCTSGQNPKGLKATRILNDQIAIDAFLSSYEKGYSALESFQERTYLYARPLLYPQRARLGLVFQSQKEEPSPNAPLYFQWASGESYRFQSFTVIGEKANEFTPNTEPVLSVRTDVKSHIFHAMFIGNFAGLPAGNSTFLDTSIVSLDGSFSVQPSFNYMALMGADYGAISISAGLFYPTFGFKVGDEQREVLGSSVSYILRGMYTTQHMRVRAIGSVTHHASGQASKSDVLTRSGDKGQLSHPDSFDFNAYYIRGGVDFDLSDRFSVGTDATLLNGRYNESVATVGNNLHFNKTTIQGYVQRHFGHYVSLNAFVDFILKDYTATFNNTPASKNAQETTFFGSLEFLF